MCEREREREKEQSKAIDDPKHLIKRVFTIGARKVKFLLLCFAAWGAQFHRSDIIHERKNPRQKRSISRTVGFKCWQQIQAILNETRNTDVLYR